MEVRQRCCLKLNEKWFEKMSSCSTPSLCGVVVLAVRTLNLGLCGLRDVVSCAVLSICKHLTLLQRLRSLWTNCGKVALGFGIWNIGEQSTWLLFVRVLVRGGRISADGPATWLTHQSSVFTFRLLTEDYSWTQNFHTI